MASINAARGAWLGFMAGLVIGMSGAVQASTAESVLETVPAAGSAAKPAEDPGKAGGSAVPTGAKVEKKDKPQLTAMRQEYARKIKAVLGTNMKMDLAQFQTMREKEKARQAKEKAGKTPQIEAGETKGGKPATPPSPPAN